MNSIGLRPATAADSEFCYRLHRAAMGPYIEAIWGWDEADQRGFHERGFDPANTQIVTIEGDDVGSVTVDRRPTEIYLGRIEILPDYQGRGIGRQLIQRLRHEAASRHQPVLLDVLVVNRRAYALYQRLGFQEIARHGENDLKIRMRAEPPGMRHLGILAHSVEGAALCLRAFCRHGSARLGPYHHPDVTLDCIAFGTSMPAWEARDFPTVRATLATSVARLAGAGADFFVCPDNTAHLALELPDPPLALPGLHIVDVLAAQAHRDGRGRVGVLGTKYTMDSDLYPRTLARYGIEAAVPDDDDRRIVNDVIFDELVEGVFTDRARSTYTQIVEKLRGRGCDAVALACTEISLLIDAESAPLPVLDSTRLLAAAAFDVAVGSAPAPTWRGGPV